MCEFVTKTEKKLFIVGEVLIFSHEKESFCEFFCASNGFKMGDNLSSSGSLSSSSPSGSSSDSSSSNSVTSYGSTSRPHSGIETGKMDECEDDVEAILDPYPKVESDTVMNDEDYEGLEYPIISDCHRELHEKFPLMKSAFGKFSVSNSLFWYYNLY